MARKLSSFVLFLVLSSPALGPLAACQSAVCATLPGRTDTITLNAEDVALAKSVDFDPEVLRLVKEQLRAQLSLGPNKIYQTEQEREDLGRAGDSYPLPQDVEGMNAIGQKYPELKDVVDARLRSYHHERIDHAANAQALKSMIASGMRPDFLKAFENQNIKPTPVKTIAVRYYEDPRQFEPIDDLQKSLNKLGYQLVRFGQFSLTRYFTDKASAQKFLAEHQTPVNEHSLEETKATEFDAVYPVDGDSELILPLGASVQKVGNRHWKIKAPTRYLATATSEHALLFKLAQGSFAQTLANYNINYTLHGQPANAKLVTALEAWDKAYGLTLLEATYQGPVVQFKSLPENLDQLCWEIGRLSEERSSQNENDIATKTRAFAGKLRAEHQATLHMIGKPGIEE